MQIILHRVTPIKYPDLPLTFVRSGYVYLSSGYINYGGSEGDTWARTAQSSTNARYLRFRTSNIYSSGSNGDRYLGFSLRCLYPGSA